MIYSKRRKNMGGGRRKRSNRKSYRSKLTKRTTLSRIKQRGGSQPVSDEMMSMISQLELELKEVEFTEQLKTDLYKEYNNIKQFKTDTEAACNYLSRTNLMKILLLLDKDKQNDILLRLNPQITNYIRECLAFFYTMISKLDLEGKFTEEQKLDLYVEYYILDNNVKQFEIETNIYYESITSLATPIDYRKKLPEKYKTNAKEFYQYLSTTKLVNILSPLDKTKQDGILSHLNPKITKYICLYLAFSITISKQPKSDSEEEKSTEVQITELYLDYYAIEVKVTGRSSATLYLQQYGFVTMLLQLNKTDQDTVLSYLNPAVSEKIREYLTKQVAEQLAKNGDKK
jgi:hypothetical protein